MNKDYYFYEKIKEKYDELDTLVGSIDMPSERFMYNNLSESEFFIRELKEKLDRQLGLQLISYLEEKQDEDLRIVFMESNKNNRDTDMTTFYKRVIIYKKKPETETSADRVKRIKSSWVEMTNENVYPNKIER